MIRGAFRLAKSVTPAPTTARAMSSAASGRPFKILGIQQIAIGALSKKDLTNFWVDTLGLTKVSTFSSAKENVDEDIISVGKGPFAVEVDLMQPLDPNKSPKVHEPALNHVGLWVDDLKACVDHLVCSYPKTFDMLFT